MNTNKMQKSYGILSDSLKVNIMLFFNMMLNFCIQVVSAYYFGTTQQRDSYFVAISLPTYIVIIFSGSLGMIFMPMFINIKTNKDFNESLKFVNNILNLLFFFLSILSILGIIFSKNTLKIIAPGFSNNQLIYTSKLLSIVFPIIIFQCLTNILTSFYYAEYRFLFPGLATLTGVFLNLIFLILFSKILGIKSLAYGTLIGSIITFMLLFLKFIYYYKFTITIKDVEVINLLKTSFPLFFSGIVSRANIIFERMIASTLPQGSISYLGYANQVMQGLFTISSIGISTTIFTAISKAWANNDMNNVKKYFVKGMRAMFFVTIPISFIFFVLGNAIIKIIFERGAFDYNATAAVSKIISILTICFIGNSLGNIIMKIFYISQKTILLAVIDIVIMIFYVILSILLSRYISYIGIAIAASIGSILSILSSILIVKNIMNGINGLDIIDGLLKILFSSVISAVSTRCFYFILKENLAPVFSTTISICFFLTIFILISVYIFGLEEARKLKDYIKGIFTNILVLKVSYK